MIIPRKKCETFLRFSLREGKITNWISPSTVTQQRMVKRTDDDILQGERVARQRGQRVGYILHGIRRLKGGYEFGEIERTSSFYIRIESYPVE